jgi:SAM-dependent methyltransferase
MIRKSLLQIYNNLPLLHVTEWSETHPGGTDKETNHSYISSFYENIFEPLRNKQIKMLEIGIAHAGSTKLWNQYFNNITIDGIEWQPFKFNVGDEYFKDNDNLNMFVVDATDKSSAELFEDNSYDIIIDDGSHYLEDQEKTLKLYYDKVKPGGLYIIEDIAKIQYCDELGKIYKHGKAVDLRTDRPGRDDNIIMYWKKKYDKKY